jgi:hypothetical protein
MTGRDPIDPSPDEEARGRDALRELRVEPLPADVLARLDGRLEGELGRPAPVRRRRRSRLLFAVPGVAVAAVAVVAVVLVTNGGGSRPGTESASSPQAKTASPSAPSASTSIQRAAAGAATDSSALTRVPVLVGRSLERAGAVAGAQGLHVKLLAKPCPSTTPDRIAHQQPRAGASVAHGATIRVSRC